MPQHVGGQRDPALALGPAGQPGQVDDRPGLLRHPVVVVLHGPDVAGALGEAPGSAGRALAGFTRLPLGFLRAGRRGGGLLRAGCGLVCLCRVQARQVRRHRPFG